MQSLEFVDELRPREPELPDKDVYVTQSFLDALIEKIPQDQQWVLQLFLEQKQKFAKGKAIIYEFGYMEHGEMVWVDHVKRHIDSKQQSEVPIVPQKYRVIEHVPGRGLVSTEHEGVRNIDPDIKTAMIINSIADLIR